jgi:hypothetical protein
MARAEDNKSEKEFNAWLDSIRFVDGQGQVVDHKLTDDISEDPEGDRE